MWISLCVQSLCVCKGLVLCVFGTNIFFLIGKVLFMCCQSIPFWLQIIHMIKAVCSPMAAICALYLVLFTIFSIFSELCGSIKIL